jgi:hypothetical protein
MPHAHLFCIVTILTDKYFDNSRQRSDSRKRHIPFIATYPSTSNGNFVFAPVKGAKTASPNKTATANAGAFG